MESVCTPYITDGRSFRLGTTFLKCHTIRSTGL